MWFMCICVFVRYCECGACMCVLVCFGPCVCVNSKLTAAVKFLSEHHRGEADGSWQGARVKGGGRERWRWAWSRGRWWLPASLMIEGLVGLCSNSVLLSKNTDAFTVSVLTLSSVTHTPWMYQLRVKQLFPLNIYRWCWSLAFGHCLDLFPVIHLSYFIIYYCLILYFRRLIFILFSFRINIINYN